MAVRVLMAAAGLAGAQLLMNKPVDDETREWILAQGQEGLESESQWSSKDLKTPKLCDPTVRQHSGYLPAGTAVGGGDKLLFFWLFESRRSPRNDPLILWLTGGPGCSSQLALLSENGPCSVPDGNTTVRNDFSWNSQANIMWLDQPVATGFSLGAASATSSTDAAKAVGIFLTNFFKQFSQYRKNAFYVFGESYGGHYVPAVGHRLWELKKTGGLQSNLKGLAIGNGLTDPEEQYKWYPQMAADSGRAQGGTVQESPITDEDTLVSMYNAVLPCTNRIKKCNTGDRQACLDAYSFCAEKLVDPYFATGLNPYDVRRPCGDHPLCYDFSGPTTFLNNPAVQKELGASKKWASCNNAVNYLFQGDWMKQYQTQLPELLADGIQVLIYAGDADYVCNWLGNKAWTLHLNWTHSEDFVANSKDEDYVVSGETVGRLRSSHGLHFMQVFQAGHMVPMDQPAVSLSLVTDFTNGKMGSAIVV